MSPIALLKAMRPHQWVKNVFVLAALLFAMGERHSLVPETQIAIQVAFAVAAFCLGSSAIYLVNDVMDIESDRKHPTKCKRPIAAGEVALPVALVASGFCVLAALGLGQLASTSAGSVTLVVACYMVMNFMYSWKLKHVAILDAFCIATGFLLRVLTGGIAAEAPVSHWLMLCTLFLALFLALCKRKAEIDLLGEGRGEHRKILREYTPEFLDQAVGIAAACAILCYTMYTVAEETTQKFGAGHGLGWTVPFVVFGLFRYLLLVQTQRGGGSPTRMLLGGDLVFVLNAVGWLATVALLLFR